MKRLFTFGCSFTFYVWPSWADLLGQESSFDHFENWGVTGIGNVAILHRLIECHSKHKFTKDDTVVIQWSSHLRNDYHRFRSPPVGRDRYGWKTKGSVFNFLNQETYDRDWVYKFFDEKSFVMYNLNAMTAAKEILENTGVTWAMTSIGDFKKLGSDIQDGVGAKETVSNNTDLFESYPEFDHYRSALEHDKWVEPLGLYAWTSQDKLYRFQGPDDVRPYTDPHPSTIMHMEWLNSVLKKKINLPIGINDIQQNWIDKTEALMNRERPIPSDEYDYSVHDVLTDWDNSYKGY